MKRGPKPGTSVIDHLRKCRAAWGHMPPEIEALARSCNAIGGVQTAAAIGYSAAVVSNMLANKYNGDTASVLIRIRGALMGETVQCPILGDLRKDRCMTEQKRPFMATNCIRARLYHACKTCPNNRQNAEADHADR